MTLSKFLYKTAVLTCVCFTMFFSESQLSYGQNASLDTPDQVQTFNGKKYTVHIVQKKETMYSLSKKYNVSIEDIQQSNPEIAEKGLRIGLVIKVPLKSEIKHDSKNTAVAVPTIAKPAPAIPPSIASLPPLLYTKPKKNTSPKDSIKPATAIKAPEPVIGDTARSISDTSLLRPNKNYLLEEYTVALFLPLHLYAETRQSEKEEENAPVQETISQSSLMGLEFYEGFKMAADSLQKEGLKARLNVYDTSGDTNIVKQVLLKPELKNANLIVGPLAPLASINKVSRFAKDNAINMVSPVANVDKVITENPFVINCTPSVKTQCRKMSEYIVDSFATANIIIIQASSPKEIDLANNFKIFLPTLFKARGIVDFRVRTVKYSEKGIAGVKEALSSAAKNLVIVPSSEEGFISVLLTGLKSQLSGSEIVVCGLPTWQKFETIDAQIFQQLNTHIFNSFYVNYDDPAILKFRKMYRQLYKTEPSDHVYHGFDAGYYYLKALMTFGKGFTEVLPELNYSMMHTVFDFEKKGAKGGYENTYISVLKYENFQLKKLNK